MTPSEVRERYVVESGRIRSPGKFEGEPEYVPAFWSLANEGGADYDAGPAVAFQIGLADAQEWPQLAEHVSNWLVLEESENGFVLSTITDVTPWELWPESCEE